MVTYRTDNGYGAVSPPTRTDSSGRSVWFRSKVISYTRLSDSREAVGIRRRGYRLFGTSATRPSSVRTVQAYHSLPRVVRSPKPFSRPCLLHQVLEGAKPSAQTSTFASSYMLRG